MLSSLTSMRTAPEELRWSNDGRALTSLKALSVFFAGARRQGVRSSVGWLQLQENTKNDTDTIEMPHQIKHCN